MLDEVKNNFPGALQVPDEKDSFIAVKLSADVREIAFKLHNEYLKETSFFFCTNTTITRWFFTRKFST